MSRKKEQDNQGISKRSGNRDVFNLPKCIWIKLKIDPRPLLGGK